MSPSFLFNAGLRVMREYILETRKKKSYAKQDFLCDWSKYIPVAQDYTPHSSAGNRFDRHSQYALCHHTQNRLEYAAGCLAGRHASWPIQTHGRHWLFSAYALARAGAR